MIVGPCLHIQPVYSELISVLDIFQGDKIILSDYLNINIYCAYSPPQVVYFFRRIKLSLNFLPYPPSLLFNLWP